MSFVLALFIYVFKILLSFDWTKYGIDDDENDLAPELGSSTRLYISLKRQRKCEDGIG